MEQQPEYPNKVMLRWLWRGYMRRHTGLILLAVFLMSIEGAMLGAFSYLIKPLFDKVLVAADKDALVWVALAVFAAFLIRAATSFIHRVLMAVVTLRVSAKLQSDLVAHMMTLDSWFFQDNSPGTLIERTRGDTAAVSAMWNTVLAAFARDLISLVSLLAVAISIDWLWTLIAIAGAPLLVLPIGLLQRRVRIRSREARGAAARISTRLDEIFHGANTIKLNATEKREGGRFAAEINRFTGAEIRNQASQAGIPAMMDVVAALGFLGVLYYGGLEIINGSKTVGDFMSFFTAMSLVFEPLRRLGNVSGVWQAALSSMERVYAVFDERPSILSPRQPKALVRPAGQSDVTLEDVQFAYGDTPVLRGVSFTAKAGQTTALVGASGAGKSTIFNLLTRLADADSGAVRIGGTDITQLDLADLRGLYSVVTQDAMLFDETLRDNITLGAKTDEAALQSALRAAHVDEFLTKLTKGLDTPAGPRGSALSGGQRQRVAIARALLRQSPILLLDEATSALDAKSERLVQDALDKLAQGRTTLVIAHRLATVRDADKIIVMDQGQVVDQGTHDELLARGGKYADLYRLQFNDGGPQFGIGRSPGQGGGGRRRTGTEVDATGSTPPALPSRIFGSVKRLFGR